MICSQCMVVKQPSDDRDWLNESGTILCPVCLIVRSLEASAREGRSSKTPSLPMPPTTSITESIQSQEGNPASDVSDRLTQFSSSFPQRKAPTNRLMVVEMLYHQSIEDQPTAFETRFARWLQTDEQPYVRKAKATEEWQPLDTGWLQESSMLLISNVEGTVIDRQPSQEEQDALASRILELGLLVSEAAPSKRTMHSQQGDQQSVVLPFGEIPPGETCRFSPVNLDRILVRCRKRSARYSVTALPR
jgi:hypothetical protein